MRTVRSLLLVVLLVSACGEATTPQSAPPPESASGDPLAAALDAALRETPDPRTVEIESVLDAKRITVDLQATPIDSAVRFIAVMAGLKIAVLPVLFEERAARELEVTVNAANATVREVLDLVGTGLGVAYWVEDGEVRIGPTRPRGEFVTLRHGVAGLLEAPGRKGWFEGDAIADLVREQVDPSVWDEDDAGVEFDDEAKCLEITAPVDVHRRVRDLLRELGE